MVVNTCAFIEAARQESIDTVLALSEARQAGCPAGGHRVHGRAVRRRAGRSPARGGPGGAVRGVADRRPAPPGPPWRLTPVDPRATSRRRLRTDPPTPSFDLLNLPRPAATAPWSYIKVAEGCDRNCGFCAIPSFRGKQRSRSGRLDPGRGGPARRAGPVPREVVLVAQDLSSFALDRSGGATEPRLDGPAVGASRPIVDLVAAVAAAGPVDPAALPLPVDARRRPGRGHPGHRRALLRPLPPARVPAAAQAHAPLGRGRPLPRPDRLDPAGRARRPPSGRRSSSGTPARPRPITTTSSSGSPRPSSTGWASSRSATRSAPTPPGSTARCPTSWWPSGCVSAPSCRTPSPPPDGRR